jgi:hypothetical protein
MAQMSKPKSNATPSLRDRVKEFKRVPSAELLDNGSNWRVHPYAQQKAMEELLSNIGIAGALTAYYSKRNDGKLTLIDGHERKAHHQADWPVLILDVTDEEADKLLLTLDPVRQMAEADPKALTELLARVTPDGVGMESLLRDLQRSLDESEVQMETARRDIEHGGSDQPIPEMELQPFEHYDYLIFPFRSSLDFLNAAEKMGLRREAFTLKDGVTRKVGLNRVIAGEKLLSMLK